MDEIKRLSLESMITLSIDEIINLYRQGYRLDNVDTTGSEIRSEINVLTYETQCSGSPELTFNNTSVLQGTFGAVRQGRVWAQRFYGNFRCLDTVEFNMKRIANVPFYIEIRKDDGVGEGKPLGVPLVDDSGLISRTSSIPYTDIPTSPGWVFPYVATILPTDTYYWICFVPADFYDSPIYRDIAHDRFWLQDGTNIADKRSAVFENGSWANSSTFAFALYKLTTFTTPSNAQVFNMCWGTGLGAHCSIPPEAPVITVGTNFTIKADIANSGSTGPVRAVFKIDGSAISDQNIASLATYPGGGFWSPTTTYTMPNRNVTLTADGYGWDGASWILTNSYPPVTISMSAPVCTGISVDASKIIANIGETITLTAYGVTPTTQAFTVNFLDRSNNVLGQCTTSNGICSSQWDTTGFAPGQYYVKAVVIGECYSTELAIGLSLPIRQWNVDIMVLDDVTSSPIQGASVIIGVRTLQTDASGHVLFTGVDEGTISIGITKTTYNDFNTIESLLNNITRIYRMIPVSQNPGSLRFMTSPPGISGAEVHFIGDVPTLKGTTDANGIFLIDNLAAGRVVNYEVRKTTYNTTTGTVTVVGNIRTDVLVTMTPVSTTGSVCIHSNPSGASIKIDITPQTDKSTALSGGGCVAANTIDNLTAGNHSYELTLAAYQNKTGTFSITVGQTLDYDAGALTPLPTLGTLNISSSPSGARIYIKTGEVYQDTGYATGTTNTPTVITTLTAGTYEYKLVLAMYVDYINTFVMTAGQTTIVDVTLAAMDICAWIISRGGWTNLAIFDIMTLVSAYLQQTNLGFPVTVAYIMGTVAYYLNNLPSGNSSAGCSFT